MENENWQIGLILPNLKVGEDFETKYVSIVNFDDNRVQKIINENSSLAKILNGFLDDFNIKVKPSVLIFNADSPKEFKNIECFVDFRNLIAISVIILNWSLLNP